MRGAPHPVRRKVRTQRAVARAQCRRDLVRIRVWVTVRIRVRFRVTVRIRVMFIYVYVIFD